MPPLNKKTGVTGVKIGYNNGVPNCYIAQMKRKVLKFRRRFIYTDEGKMMAGNFYQKKLIEIDGR